MGKSKGHYYGGQVGDDPQVGVDHKSTSESVQDEDTPTRSILNNLAKPSTTSASTPQKTPIQVPEPGGLLNDLAHGAKTTDPQDKNLYQREIKPTTSQ